MLRRRDAGILLRRSHFAPALEAESRAGTTVEFDPDRLDLRDAALIARMLPIVQTAARVYVRLRVEGFESIGREPVLYVANHNGGIAGPDVACTLATLWGALGAEHPLYALAHDFAMRHVPRFGALIQRFGALRAAPDNAARALAAGAQVLVYPGGDLEAYRASRRRDRIVLGARTGFVRLAQRAGVPIVPIVAHGAHRSAYIVTDGEAIARRIALKRWARLERFPIAFSLPWGVALGPWAPYLPLPFPIRLRALPAIAPRAADDPCEVAREVESRMQAALDDLGAAARSRVSP
jgi:1-acyl-sn-glycerol-3-phosphate acyltransferase